MWCGVVRENKNWLAIQSLCPTWKEVDNLPFQTYKGQMEAMCTEEDVPSVTVSQKVFVKLFSQNRLSLGTVCGKSLE